MRWLKRDLWKAGIAVAGMLLLLVLMAWVPVSAAGAHEIASGLAGPVTVTVQVTPTEDATVTALNKEKLAQEVDQLKNQNYWAWTTVGPILVGFAGLLAALYSFITWIRNRQDEQKKRDEEQKRWLDDRQAERERRDEEQLRWLEDRKAERERRAEERFQSAVEGLGSEREEARVGAAIVLRTFLRKGYEQFYIQTFDLAVANLRLRHLDADTPEPLTSLSQALIIVFKESFPLAREQLKQSPQLLDASCIQLDNAHLAEADLQQVWIPEASLRNAALRRADFSQASLYKANLFQVDLRESILTKTNLYKANLVSTDLSKAHLSEADLRGADLSRATLSEANLSRTHLNDVKLINAKLGGANLSGADLTSTLRRKSVGSLNG